MTLQELKRLVLDMSNYAGIDITSTERMLEYIHKHQKKIENMLGESD